MNINRNAFRRSFAFVAALAIAVGAVLPALGTGQVSADQLTSRAIKMSTSTPSASAQYEITFTTGAAVGTTEELVIDFCGDTPLYEATCAFSAATVPTIAAPTSSAGTPSTVGAGSPVHTVLITGLTMAQNTTYTITLTGGVTNPTSVTSFYARVYTYNTGDGADYVPAGTTGDPTDEGNTSVDFGGIALSTVEQVTITARVMETLTFCVTKDNLDGTGGASLDTCAEATLPPAVDIGLGTPKVLDASRIDSDTVYTQLSTNATNGAIVRMKATNTCANGGLSAGDGTVCNIPGINGGGDGSTPTNLVAGTAAYGLFVSDSRTTSTGAPSTGTITPNANYNNGTNENEGAPDTIHYGMDNRNTTDGVRSTYGDAIASSSGPVSRINNNLVFAATSSLTTPAGIYTGNEILIATGNILTVTNTGGG
jgi:hypothetical protein